MIRNTINLLIFISLALLPQSGFAQEECGSSVAGDTIVDGNTAFALDLYAQLAAGSEGNLFLSPYSISTALAMTYAGARGETEAQMAETLHFALPQESLHEAFKKLLESQKSGGEESYELAVANALWGQKGYGFLDEFLELTRSHYGAGLKEVDFAADSESARRTINAWVERETRNKIQDLIPPNSLSPLTSLVLTNAIYFKGKWEVPFEKNRTKEESFFTIGGKTIETPLMHQVDSYGYFEQDAFQALELPYIGDALSMVIFLPREKEGLADFEKTMTLENLKDWTARLSRRRVIVALPKFEMTSQFSLKETLQNMGMKDAFGGDADFSGMTAQNDLNIDKVLHKAFVEVNEEGTEAAAATGVIMTRTSLSHQPRPPLFRADHPFLFLIRDKRSGSILFLGRLVNPKA